MKKNKMLYGGVYAGKKVLITGETGFKGSWLATWLTQLGAKVIGYSLYLPSNPCNYEVSRLSKHITHIAGDVRDIKKLRNVFSSHHPEIVFHLAAQPIVRKSYDDPKLTFDTNIGGTVNILECISNYVSVKAGVIITSDKCYQNNNWLWGYRENDLLGGDDPYSISKAAAELVCRSYVRSIIHHKNKRVRIATTRAGNVIGGGDWAQDRIIPDCARSWSKGATVVIRHPHATRPWQHVLEPLSGYLWLGSRLYNSSQLHGEAFNFGPAQKVNQSVEELIALFSKYWGRHRGAWRIVRRKDRKKESGLLKLSCDKALHMLQWFPVLSFDKSVQLTAEWYRQYYLDNADMLSVSCKQIELYISAAQEKGLDWTQ
ncbi:MAG: CDP-glucose 4,6-dehydratase [Candidatus Margulisiibacteriota bacterium]